MPYPTLPCSLSTPRTRLVRPDPALAAQLRQALLESYTLHQPFLAWAKPDWTLQEVCESLQLSAREFLDPQPKSGTSCCTRTVTQSSAASACARATLSTR
ncbi:N-acetyltransferase GCN5 [Pseudomonas putida]|uniref:N-acetyltransferase GCN5 n=1 Tax=Pseudomonas putida TaxID=303 RepID=A0A379KRI7_PSEPU|nr:hypothetical protein [Pseudomonas putida]SUD70105.1 N-acetyltransferase GCN5 [Pseudomonas putida]